MTNVFNKKMFGTNGRGSKLPEKCIDCFYFAKYAKKYECDLTSYTDEGIPYAARCKFDKSAILKSNIDRFKPKDKKPERIDREKL